MKIHKLINITALVAPSMLLALPSADAIPLKPEAKSVVVATDYPNSVAVREKYHSSRSEVTTNWKKYLKTADSKVDWFDADTGEYLFSTITNGRVRHGALMAIPNSDFIVEDEFTYLNGGKVEEGKVVAVDILILGVAKIVGEDVYRNTVKNLVESGMSIPASVERKAFRVMATKTAAKMRFGAAMSQYLNIDTTDGKARFLLLGCSKTRANELVTPMTKQGAVPRKK